MSSATTVQGSDVTVTVDGDAVQINEANVVSTDVAAINGVIHIIDAVILPEERFPPRSSTRARL